MSDAKNIPVFTLRNDEGFTLNIGTWNGNLQMKVWTPKFGKNAGNGGPPVGVTIFPEVLHEISDDCLEIIKKDMGYSISKMATKWSADTKEFKPMLLWTVKKAAAADHVYSLTLEFVNEKKTFTFPFKRFENITCTSEQESIEQVSLRMMKRFIEYSKPNVIAFAKGYSKGTEPYQPNGTVVDSKVGTNSGFGGSPNTAPDEDIPF